MARGHQAMTKTSDWSDARLLMRRAGRQRAGGRSLRWRTPRRFFPGR